MSSMKKNCDAARARSYVLRACSLVVSPNPYVIATKLNQATKVGSSSSPAVKLLQRLRTLRVMSHRSPELDRYKHFWARGRCRHESSQSPSKCSGLHLSRSEAGCHCAGLGWDVGGTPQLLHVLDNRRRERELVLMYAASVWLEAARRWLVSRHSGEPRGCVKA